MEMLLEMIDKTHRGMYDFVYLPIDFKVMETVICNFPWLVLQISPVMFVVLNLIFCTKTRTIVMSAMRS